MSKAGGSTSSSRPIQRARDAHREETSFPHTTQTQKDSSQTESGKDERQRDLAYIRDDNTHKNASSKEKRQHDAAKDRQKDVLVRREHETIATLPADRKQQEAESAPFSSNVHDETKDAQHRSLFFSSRQNLSPSLATSPQIHGSNDNPASTSFSLRHSNAIFSRTSPANTPKRNNSVDLPAFPVIRQGDLALANQKLWPVRGAQ